jgi:hypothetical protein
MAHPLPHRLATRPLTASGTGQNSKQGKRLTDQHRLSGGIVRRPSGIAESDRMVPPRGRHREHPGIVAS